MRIDEAIHYLERIKQEYDCSYEEDALNMAIAALSSSEKPNKSEIPTGWIPVSERLPEIHQDILLSLRSLDVEVGFMAETEPYFYCHGAYIEPQNVLAWMPLPEPYKASPTGAEREDKE